MSGRANYAMIGCTVRQ